MSHRRQFLSGLGAGFGSLALAGLLAEEATAVDSGDVLTPRPSTVAPRAKRVIMLFLSLIHI